MPTEFMIVLFVLLGLLSGVLGGLLGIGGGVVTVPALYFIFSYSGMLEERIMQVAVSTSLASGFITSLVSTLAQFRKRAIQIEVVKFLIPGLILGCAAGSILAHLLSSHLLTLIFGMMAITLGVYFFFPRFPHPYISSKPNRTLSFFGVGIGCLSSLLGIGGGSLAFPILLGYQIPAKHASATSSASTLLTTFIGSISYLAIAWNNPELPETFGYIEIPAFLAVSVGAALTSPLGVKLSHSMDVAHIKQIFGCSLALVGISMLFFSRV